MIYFVIAVCLLLVLSAFTPDNEPRTRMERLLKLLPDFDPAFRIDDQYNARAFVMDPASRRLAIGMPGKPIRVIGFDQLVAVEIERNGVSIERTNRGSQIVGAAVGGALLGPAGLLLGGLTGAKRQESSIKRLVLKLTVNDLHDPVIDIVFLDTDAKVTMPPKKPINIPAEQLLSEWYGRLRVILHAQKYGGEPTDPAPAAIGLPSRRKGLIASG